jgi:putative peptidoglycan lipid II flippase
MALVAVAATSAVFPALKAMGHKGDLFALRKLHDTTHRNVAFFALPASVGLFVLSGPVMQFIFERGAFTGEGVERGASALSMLCLAILPAGATGLCARTYYALGDFAHPVRISISMLIANVGLNMLLIMKFGMDVDGLSLATVISSWGTVLLMLPGLSKRLPKSTGGTVKGIAIMLIPTLACGLAAHFGWLLLAERMPKWIALAGAISAGGFSYGAISLALGIPEARRLVRRTK